MKTTLIAALLLATASANSAEPMLSDFWSGRAVFSITGESLDTDTRKGLHFLSDVKQPDGRYAVFYIRNEGAVTLSGTVFPLQSVGLAYTRDWKTFNDAGRVLPRGVPGAFDERIASFADVWRDTDGRWHMVYEGAGMTASFPGDIGYATSSNGVNWTKHGMILKHSGNGERGNNGTPSLFKEGGTWYMHYHGFDGTDVRVFGASGTSLTSLTRMNGGRALVNTSANGFDSGTVGKRSVIKMDGYYWMVYEASTEQPFDRARWTSGLARSRDLVNWEKWQGTGGPVLPVLNGFGNDGPEWVTTPDGKLNIYYRKPGNTTGRAVLVWNTAPVQEWLYQAETHLSHQVGRRDAEGWSAATALDGSGYLSYGPYTTSISPGARSATWRLLIDNHTANGGTDTVATLDVFDANANRSLVTQNLRRGNFSQANAYQLFTLSFNALAGQRLEFRLHWKDRAYIRQDYVRVR
ncbi:MAG: hypothetical protein HC841_01300 [Verrucomicrobiae bacterium]|nr:hypothetical protein [Verrucomicrobiae bacterium]